MLSPPDSHLVRREPGIPGLALLLDDEAFTSMLQLRCPDAGVRSAIARYVRYKPGTDCLVGYRIEYGRGEVDVYAKAFRRGDRSRLDKAMAQEVITGPLGSGRFVLEDSEVVVSMFPNDSRLRSLRRIAGDDRSLLERISRDLPELRDATVTRLRYKPERRFVARLDVDGKAAALLKIYGRDGYSVARFAAESLRRAQGGPERQTLIFRSDRRQVLVFNWLDGIELGDLLRRREAQADILERTGAALAALHALEGKGLRISRARDTSNVVTLEELTKWIVAVLPWASRRIRRLSRNVANALDESARGIVRIVHGDFYASQVLIEGDTARLIDLDEARMGDPLEDLGNFAAHLDRQAVHGEIDQSAADLAVTALLTGYSAERGAEIPARQLAANHAVALFRLLPAPFRLRDPAWDETTMRLVDRIEKILGATSVQSSGVDAVSPDQLREQERALALSTLIDRSCDRDVAQPYFREAQGLDQSLQILSIRLLRQRKSRRALIEYQLLLHPGKAIEQETTLLGKIRVKGLDEATFETCLDLRRHGFDDESPTGVSIPEPVAKVPGLRMWLQRKVAGVPASKAIFGDAGTAIGARVGEAAARIHATPVLPGRRHTLLDELTILRARLEPIVLDPQFSEHAAKVLELAEACTSVLPPRPLTPIHRDFYADHLLFEGDRVWILDLDLFCEGDPALDVGNFIAHVEELAIRKHGGYEAAFAPSRALVERYRSVAGEGHELAIEVYTGLSLARLAGISRRFDTRRQWTSAILERAIDVLESVQIRVNDRAVGDGRVGGES